MSPTISTSFCEFIKYYHQSAIQGYADISICLIGVIFNVLNILVFTRRKMISSANVIFTHLAVADALNLLTSILYTWTWFFQYMQPEITKLTYTLAVIHVSSLSLVNTFRFMCVFFTVMLAIWRYIAIAYPLKARHWCTMKITQNAVIACYVTSVLLSSPLYFSFNIVPMSNNSTAEKPLNYTLSGREKEDSFMYNMANNSTAENPLYYTPFGQDDWFMYNIAMTIKPVLQQAVPSVVLSIFSVKLMVTLYTKGSTNELQRSRSNIQNNPRNAKMKQQADRLIMITLTVMVLFLITQIPLAAINLIQELLPNIYSKMDSDLQFCCLQCANLLSSSTFYYINMSVSFLVYYAMSKNFRTTFLSLFTIDSINSQKKKVFRVITMRKTRTSPEEGNANRNTDQTIQSQTVNTFV